MFGTVAGRCCQARQRLAFINGAYSDRGWWYFFPYTFTVKTPLTLFVLMAVPGAAALWHWRSAGPSSQRSSIWQGFYATAPLWVLLAVYSLTAINTNLNIGHRHLLPIYPAIFILTGAAGYWFHRGGPRRRINVRHGPVACLSLTVIECTATFPNYLAYFNPLAGGPRNSYRHLSTVRSTGGRTCPSLKRWLKENGLDSSQKPRLPGLLRHLQSRVLWHCGHRLSLFSRTGNRFRRATRWFASALRTWSQSIRCQWAHGACRTGAHTYQQLLSTVPALLTADRATQASMIRSQGKAFWQRRLTLFTAYQWARLSAFLQQQARCRCGPLDPDLPAHGRDLQNALFGPPPELNATHGLVVANDRIGRDAARTAAQSGNTPWRGQFSRHRAPRRVDCRRTT